MTIEEAQQRGLALWAADCAERALPVFENAHPNDSRPRKAVEAGRAWARGEIPLSAARGASSKANAAAREAEEKSPAREAARSAGHAAAAAHNPDHTIHAAAYAVLAICGTDAEASEQERLWQSGHLPQDLHHLVYPEDDATE